jgi:hypothetical protein
MKNYTYTFDFNFEAAEADCAQAWSSTVNI